MAERSARVVIVGAGFGGLNAAKALANSPLQVNILDKHNYHLFQPLLYQVATSSLSATDISYPVRAIFRKQENVRFRLTEVEHIDLDAKIVHTSTGPMEYDYLILAVGGETNYFGLESVMKHGRGLKDLQDSITIRNHILRTFELSTQEQDPQVCQALRTFVVVGGGPTGVEFAGALSELIRLVLSKDFPELDFSDVRVIILEMTDRLLVGFPEDLALKAAKELRAKHVEIHFGTRVSDYDGRRVVLDSGEEIPAFTLVWAAGVKASSLVDALGMQQASKGRLVVDPTLQLPGHPEVFVVGDAAFLEQDGEPLPMLAPVAIQQAKQAARNILHLQAGRSPQPFQYDDPGSMATIGRNVAVARVGRFKFHGFLAWLVWLGVHLVWLIGFRNRLLVLINWAADYLFYERAMRLITPDSALNTKTAPWELEPEHPQPFKEPMGE
jgi:NADH dehydrogenase